MAITHGSQIFQTSSVNKAIEYLDNVISQLSSAKEYLLDAKNYCGYDVFHTNEGNKFPGRIQADVNSIELLVGNCQELKNRILSKARDIHQQDLREYQEYLESLQTK